MKKYLIISTLVAMELAFGLDASAQPRWHELEKGPHAVGFRLFVEHDATRMLADEVAGGEQPRRVRVYVWYPAVKGDQAPMRFGRYASLADDDPWPYPPSEPLRQKLSFARGALARSLGPEGFEALAEQTLRALENAEPLEGPFPLVVIAQGLYYESPIAFVGLSEYLAGRGFVVATSPLVGTRAPLVKLDVEDLETCVRDLELVIARARELPYVSPDTLGVVGYDMGGMAGLILAMRNVTVDAFASVSSGIVLPHPSGLPQASPDYDPLALRAPWLHMGWQLDASSDSASLFDTAVHADRYLLQIEGHQHVDPTSYALVEGRPAVLGYWPAWDEAGLERHRLITGYLSAFLAAFLQNDSEGRAYLDKDAAPGLSLEHRAAVPPSMTYERFVQALLSGDGASAIHAVRELRHSEPSSELLSDFILYRLTYSLLYSWGLDDEALAVSELNVELNPASTLATQGLSMSHVARGDYASAVEVYRRLLEKRPDDESVKRTLEWLQGQLESKKRP